LGNYFWPLIAENAGALDSDIHQSVQKRFATTLLFKKIGNVTKVQKIDKINDYDMIPWSQFCEFQFRPEFSTDS
jgi:hypothetical protein